MILIKSIDRDVSTDHVIRWLHKYKAPFTRLNNVSAIKKMEFTGDAFVLELEDGRTADFNKIKAYWYRRGNYSDNWTTPSTENSAFDKTYQEYIMAENQALGDFFVHHVKEHTPGIGDSDSCTVVNKNIILLAAGKCGLAIPGFIITTQSAEVKKLIGKYGKVITKPIHSAFIYGGDTFWMPTYTENVSEEVLQNMPLAFKPTLFQQYIEKKFEVRAFYLEGTFYSMAIFSQNDDQTKTDFRMYNDDRPNRTVPFELPEDVAEKLHQLMLKMKFESGSIDLIYGTDHIFYFLEINPIGQFGMVSYPCNYRLEEKIASSLFQKYTS